MLVAMHDDIENTSMRPYTYLYIFIETSSSACTCTSFADISIGSKSSVMFQVMQITLKDFGVFNFPTGITD